jgi:hypothetical protein
MEDVGKLYGHLVYFKGIWYISWSIGIVYDYLVYLKYLVYFVVIWYILCLFGIFSHVFLATLGTTRCDRLRD